MTDKQIIFKCDVDCIRKNTEECFELDCIKGQESILKQLKAKEQECEELKKWIKEHLKDVEFIEKNPVIDILNSMANNILLQQQLDQLKAENEILKEKITISSNSDKITLKIIKTLTEIKEIAKVEIECKTYEIEHDCFNETRCKALNEHIDFTEQILQKISECGVE